MRAIISHGLYIFYPIFEDHFFVFQESFFFKKLCAYVWLRFESGSNQELVMMARTVVQILVHSHFDILSLLLTQFATRTVAQMATQMISSVAISLYLKRDMGKNTSSLLSSTTSQSNLKFW